MNCADFESRLNDELDGSSAFQAPDLVEHAAQCATCRKAYEGFRLLADGLGAWRHETPDVDLAAAVVFALTQSAHAVPQTAAIDRPRSSASQPQTKRRAPGLAITAAAALLTVASLWVVLYRGAPLDKPVAQVPTVQENKTAAIDQRRGDGQPATPPAAKRVPYYDLAHRAAGALGQMTMLVLPASHSTNGTAPSHSGEEPSAERPAGWMDDVERELKPVGRSLDNAFDFLWRAGESADG